MIIKVVENISILPKSFNANKDLIILLLYFLQTIFAAALLAVVFGRPEAADEVKHRHKLEAIQTSKFIKKSSTSPN